MFRYLAKGTDLLNDRQYLRAFKLSSFFHVKTSKYKSPGNDFSMSFDQIPDQHVYKLHEVFDSVTEQYRKVFKKLLHVALYTTNDYLMLIPDTETKNILQTIFDMIKQEFEQIGLLH